MSAITRGMTGDRRDIAKAMLNKVPEVTLFFWIVKILATTVGETAADFLATNLNLGLTTTSLIMAGLLAVVLTVQFRTRRYVPSVYWLAVVLISIVGTDNLVDNFGVSLVTTTVVFAAALAATFAAWYAKERTLSIHTIVTSRREGFYWLAILATFALGTSGGDLLSEGIGIGYAPSIAIFGTLIALVTIAFWRGGLNAVLAFWTAYVLTRPLGASIGDFLTADHGEGGLALGTNTISLAFLAVILGSVAWFHVVERREGALEVPA